MSAFCHARAGARRSKTRYAGSRVRALRRWIEYLAYRAFAAVVPWLPRGAVVWLGRRGGALYLLLSPRARRTGLENLARAFPARKDHWRILLESSRLQGVALMDSLWSARMSREDAAKVIDLGEWEREQLRAALAEGHGAVVATAHFGSWEMFNVAGGALGIPRATFIARPVRNERIDRHLRARRERTGNQLVYREDALVRCIAALRRGEIACSVIDMAVVPWQGGTFVDFFGTPALTSAALPLLSVRLAAPLLFALCIPIEKGRRYRIEGAPIPVDRAAGRDVEVPRLTRVLNAALEDGIRRHPEAWIWSYKRWKWRPSEDPGAYPSYAQWVGAFDR
jgi:KDO2-lipid IV(A) lauroyltransferase